MKSYTAAQLGDMMKPQLVDIAVQLEVYAPRMRNRSVAAQRDYARQVGLEDLRKDILAAQAAKNSGTQQGSEQAPPPPPEFKQDPPKINVQVENEAGRALWTLIEPSVMKSLSDMQREAVEAAATAAIEKVLPRTISVELRDATGAILAKVDRAHRCFPDLVKWVQPNPVTGRRENPLLIGPAGSAKTSAARQLALALGLTYRQQSIGPQTSESKLVGYNDADGRPVRTAIWDTYEHGGVCCIDEIDSGNGGVLTVLNSLLDNGHASFCGTMVERHPDAIFVGTANTFGRGADRVYVGRQPLDGATLDRWVPILWDYDTEFEKALFVKSQADLKWFEFVLKVREAVFALGLRVIVGPRSTRKGIHGLSVGFTWAEVEDAFWSNWSTDDRAKVQAHLQQQRRAA